jgi:hypothetical protein
MTFLEWAQVEEDANVDRIYADFRRALTDAQPSTTAVLVTLPYWEARPVESFRFGIEQLIFQMRSLLDTLNQRSFTHGEDPGVEIPNVIRTAHVLLLALEGRLVPPILSSQPGL